MGLRYLELGHLAFLADRGDFGLSKIALIHERIAIASQRKQIFAIDIQTSTNSLLINLLLNEAEMLIMSGRKVMVIADNIQQSDSNLLQNFLKKSMENMEKRLPVYFWQPINSSTR